VGALGCAASTGERPSSASPATSAVSSELSGVWSEYWAVAGQAETQRYTFSDNGKFHWSAAPSASAPQAGTPLAKRGSFELRGSDQLRWLVLHVAATDLAGCDSACEGEDDVALHIEHAPALLEELELSECPPNIEAQHLDTHYACVALGEHAFWRGPKTEQPALTPN
jgi:hypothetical protein